VITNNKWGGDLRMLENTSPGKKGEKGKKGLNVEKVKECRSLLR